MSHKKQQGDEESSFIPTQTLIIIIIIFEHIQISLQMKQIEGHPKHSKVNGF